MGATNKRTLMLYRFPCAILILPFKGRAEVGMGHRMNPFKPPIPIPPFPLKGKEKLVLAQALAAFTAACYAAALGAQGTAAYPQRNVQIVVPYTPGTGADIIARTLGPRLSERWNVGVIADNRPGATGNIGADFVAKAVPDGHIVLMTATSF